MERLEILRDQVENIKYRESGDTPYRAPEENTAGRALGTQIPDPTTEPRRTTTAATTISSLLIIERNEEHHQVKA
ncbi:hypothetical protein ACFX14_044758 [Malus domestica]